jgi:hypothetical protein
MTSRRCGAPRANCSGGSGSGPGTSSRLLRNASVCSRIAELKQLVCNNTTQRFLELAIAERDQRLMAIQDRWDRLREAILARAVGDYLDRGGTCRQDVQKLFRSS